MRTIREHRFCSTRLDGGTDDRCERLKGGALGCLLLLGLLLGLGWLVEALPPIIGQGATNLAVFVLAIVGWAAIPRERKLEALVAIAGLIFGFMVRGD